MSATEATPQDVIRFKDVDWCELTTVGLKINRRNVAFQDWEKALPELTVANRGSRFGLGDWLLLGEAKYGDKCAQAIDPAAKKGLKVKTVLEYRRVSEKIPLSIRIESVDWSLNQIIAGLPEEERAGWIHLAAVNSWTVEELKKALKGPKDSLADEEGEIERLNSPEVVAWYAETLKLLRQRHGDIPHNVSSLRTISKWIQETLERHRGRTVQTDCDAILEFFTGENHGEKKGSPCAEIASQGDIFWWLYSTGYHLIDADLKARLKTLVEKEILRDADTEDARGEGQKGAMTATFGQSRKFLRRCRELSLAEKPECSHLAIRKAIQEFMKRRLAQMEVAA